MVTPLAKLFTNWLFGPQPTRNKSVSVSHPHSASGLADCYVAALPFHCNQLVGDLVYTGAPFGLHALAVSVRERAVARV